MLRATKGTDNEFGWPECSPEDVRRLIADVDRLEPMLARAERHEGELGLRIRTLEARERELEGFARRMTGLSLEKGSAFRVLIQMQGEAAAVLEGRGG